MPQAAALLARLVQQGHRLTPVRRGILSSCTKSEKPLSALELQTVLHHTLGKLVNKTTIYRELDFLAAQNILSEIDFGDGKKRYERADLPHHHHAVCTNCKKVEEVTVDDRLEALEKKIYRKLGFKTARHQLEFFGVCQGCR